MVRDIQVTIEGNIVDSVSEQLLVIKDHDQLDHLDYASSGHTGFASSNELELAKEELHEEHNSLFDDSGNIKSTILPSYVDDVLEFDKQVTGETFMDQILASDIGSFIWIAANKSYTGDTYYRKFVTNTDGTEEGLIIKDPENGKIYVSKTEGTCYRWSGSNLVEISKSITLGETSTTAYAGNKGKANADAISVLQTSKADATEVVSAVGSYVSISGSDDDIRNFVNSNKLSDNLLQRAITAITSNLILPDVDANKREYNRIRCYAVVFSCNGNSRTLVFEGYYTVRTDLWV